MLARTRCTLPERGGAGAAEGTGGAADASLRPAADMVMMCSVERGAGGLGGAAVREEGQTATGRLQGAFNRMH